MYTVPLIFPNPSAYIDTFYSFSYSIYEIFTYTNIVRIFKLTSLSSDPNTSIHSSYPPYRFYYYSYTISKRHVFPKTVDCLSHSDLRFKIQRFDIIPTIYIQFSTIRYFSHMHFQNYLFISNLPSSRYFNTDISNFHLLTQYYTTALYQPQTLS